MRLIDADKAFEIIDAAYGHGNIIRLKNIIDQVPTVRQVLPKEDFQTLLSALRQRAKNLETLADQTHNNFDRGEAAGARKLLGMVEAFEVGIYNSKGIDI